MGQWSWERLGESHLCKTMASSVPSIIDIYSLVHTILVVHTICLNNFDRSFLVSMAKVNSANDDIGVPSFLYKGTYSLVWKLSQ